MCLVERKRRWDEQKLIDYYPGNREGSMGFINISFPRAQAQAIRDNASFISR
jgi:hypothetical protein